MAILDLISRVQKFDIGVSFTSKLLRKDGFHENRLGGGLNFVWQQQIHLSISETIRSL
jgi:hypothetical protein